MRARRVIIGLLTVFVVAMTARNAEQREPVKEVEAMSDLVGHDPVSDEGFSPVGIAKILDDTESVTVEPYCGWSITSVNVRERMTTKSGVIETLPYATTVTGYKVGEWIAVDGGYAISRYFSDSAPVFVEKDVPGNHTFKSYMSYKILSERSKQGKLQVVANTSETGIRKVNGRYCVALGSYYSVNIGQYFDLILENGTSIPCILADGKSDNDTDSKGVYTLSNGCVSEFIVDPSKLVQCAKVTGNISNVNDEWNSPVVRIRLYKKTYFGE